MRSRAAIGAGTTSMTPARQSAEVTRSATQKTPVAVTETLNLA